MPTSKTSCKASILAFLANSQRKLIIRHDNRSVIVLIIDVDTGYASRRKCIGHIYSGVFIPLDHINALIAKSFNNHAHTGPL